MDLLNYSIDGPTPLMNDLVKFIFNPPDERAKHWSFQTMAIGAFHVYARFRLFREICPERDTNLPRRFNQQFKADVASKRVWFASSQSVYKNFDDQML